VHREIVALVVLGVVTVLGFVLTRAAADLKRQGITGQQFHDTVRNVQYVRVGPLNSYESAVGVKQRVLGKYRDALIMP